MIKLLRHNDFLRLIIMAYAALLLLGIYNLRISTGVFDMDPSTLVALGISAAGFFLSLVIAIVAAVVMVMNIKIITATLTEALDGLKESVDKLGGWLAKVDRTQDQHAIDIAKLQQRDKDCKSK